MAAISYPSSPRQRPRPAAPAAPAGRHLRLIQGGRSTSASVAPGVYARRRILALVTAAIVVMALVLAVQAVGSRLVVRGGPAAPVAPVEAPVGASVHVVQPGETLWAIAGELTPADGDIRATVDQLVDRNGGITSLQVGQRLVLE